jgi:hypothetical protein
VEDEVAVLRNFSGRILDEREIPSTDGLLPGWLKVAETTLTSSFPLGNRSRDSFYLGASIIENLQRAEF